MKSNCYLFVKVEMNFSNKKKTKRVGPKRFYVGITWFVNILFKRRSVEKNMWRRVLMTLIHFFEEKYWCVTSKKQKTFDVN